MIKAVIFDLDGVIINSEPLWEKATKIYLEQLGKKFPTTKSFGRYVDINFRGRVQKEVVPRLKKKFKIEGTYNDIMKMRMKILIKVFDKELKLVPGVIALIKKINSKKIPMVIASSSPHIVVKYSIRRFGLKKYFKKIISGENIKNGKPAPDIFIKASKQFKNIKPEEILVIEDSYSGIMAAKNADMQCLAIHHSYTMKKYFKKADMIVDTFNKINFNKIINL
ncbi:MAG: HAD family phosphatase [bacterium]|nr:HAD family phosphatase [bacterium]